jgi:hypothetical protein
MTDEEPVIENGEAGVTEEAQRKIEEIRKLMEPIQKLNMEVLDLHNKVHHLERQLREATHALAAEAAHNEGLHRYMNGEVGKDATRLEVFMEVQEDWYGNFRIAADARYPDTKLVHVFLTAFLDGSGWKVAVWGNDDCGMEREFPTSQRKEALQLYTDIVTKKFPTRAWLRLKGLENG